MQSQGMGMGMPSQGGMPVDQAYAMGGQTMNMGPNPWASNASLGAGMTPTGMMTGNPAMMNNMQRGQMGVMNDGYIEDFSRMAPQTMRTGPMMFDPMPGMPGETVVSERIEAPVFVAQNFIGQEWVTGVKPYVTMEKIVEIPQTIVKETPRMVPKPEIVERIIQVPKMMYKERETRAPSLRQPVFQDRIIEVARNPVVETSQQTVPKIDIQERLIEIPRIEFREKIEYEDVIEYREVPVDKIIEVPEIEYVIRDVERFVPQDYVQERPVDRYHEVPVQQIQEVHRHEYVPVIDPVPNYKAVGIPVPTPMQSMPMQSAPMGSMPMGTMPMTGMPPMGQTMNMGQSFNMPPTMPMGTMGTMGQSFQVPPTMPMGGPPTIPMGAMGQSFASMPMSGRSMPGIPPTGQSMMNTLPGGGMPQMTGMPQTGQSFNMGMMNTVPGGGMPRTNMSNSYANYTPLMTA